MNQAKISSHYGDVKDEKIKEYRNIIIEVWKELSYHPYLYSRQILEQEPLST